MAVENKTVSADEQKREQKTQQEKASEIGNALVDALDLPFDGPKNADDPDQGEEIPKPEFEEDDDVEEEQDVEESEEESSEDDVAEEEEEDEDLIPKSKFNKRLQSEVARRKVLEARLAEMEAKTSEPKDSRREKLEGMSSAELDDLDDQIDEALFEARQSGDDSKKSELRSLRREVRQIRSQGPQKKQEAQVKAYNDAVNSVMSDPDNEGIDFDKDAEAIKTIAEGLYQKFPELQKMTSGQATALKMAVEHFRETKTLKKGKSEVKNLKRKNNKLKRKVSLDSSAVKGKISRSDFRKKIAEAKKSPSFYDKEAAMKDILNVDRYLS